MTPLFDPALDVFPLLAASAAALSCGLLGNVLVLRRESLMGDAISHSVLPGLAIAFLVAGSRDPLWMLLGAVVAGVATVGLIELVKRFARVEPGAAMGVVFSVAFAIGVVLIERAARNTDLDADCVLYGSLETLVWFGAPGDGGIDLSAMFGDMPRQVWMLLATLAAVACVLAALFKELRISAFDPDGARAQGIPARGVLVGYLVLVAVATVAAFEAVGSILVLAMLIAPAATARLLTDRFSSQIWVSAGAALAAAVVGYFAASLVPAWFGSGPVRASGSIAVVAGLGVAGAAVFGPRHGAIARMLVRRRVARRVLLDDVVAAVYRAHERGSPEGGAAPAEKGVRLAVRAGLLEASTPFELTAAGRRRATEIVRKHRLWERYLVDSAGVAPDHVHPTAEALEHLGAMPPESDGPDPHGRRIPPPAD